MSNNSNQEIKKPEVKVAIWTPYLSESLGNFIKKCKSPEEFMFEIGVAKYNPINLSGISKIETLKYKVNLYSPDYEEARYRIQEINPSANLIITGCTRGGEEEVMHLQKTGILIARYSLFYGGPSRYTNRMPESAGYSFDIPKEVSIVSSFLTHDSLLEGIINRNEDEIRASIDDLNKTIEQKIIITPYLTNALGIKKTGGSA